MKNKLLLSMILYVRCCYASEDYLISDSVKYRYDAPVYQGEDPMGRAIFWNHLDIVRRELKRGISLEEQERYVDLAEAFWDRIPRNDPAFFRKLKIYGLLCNARTQMPGAVKLPMNLPTPIEKKSIFGGCCVSKP